MLVYRLNKYGFKEGQVLPDQTGSCRYPSQCTTCKYFYFKYDGNHICEARA